jgi:hypothetical protein
MDFFGQPLQFNFKKNSAYYRGLTVLTIINKNSNNKLFI